MNEPSLEGDERDDEGGLGGREQENPHEENGGMHALEPENQASAIVNPLHESPVASPLMTHVSIIRG